MVVQPDLLVRDTMKALLAEVAAAPSLLDDVFKGRPADELAEIRTYVAEHQVPVKLGWPREIAELPGFYVILGGDGEDRQVVGGDFEPDKDAPDDMVEATEGSWFRGSVRTMCWTVNADLTVWLAMIAKWGLLRARRELGDAGLREQTLAGSDFMPLPQWFPDFAYGRDVTLTALAATTVSKKFQKLREVDVAATDPSGGGATFSASWRP